MFAAGFNYLGVISSASFQVVQHDMDASHPAHCVEVFWMPVSPSRPSPGLRGGPKGAPKIFTFWPFQPSKRPRGQSSRHQNIKLPRWPLEVQPGLHFYSFGLQTTSDVG